MNSTENTRNDDGSWVEHIKPYLEDKSAMENVLKAINQPFAEFIKINKPYTVDNDRVGVIAQIQNPGITGTEQIIIDIRHGVQSYQQLIDLVFGVGADCKTRILIFDDEEEDYNTLHNGGKTRISLNYLNEHNANIYVVRFDRNFIIEMSELNLLRKPSENSKHYVSSLIKQIKLKKERIDIFDFMPFYSKDKLEHFKSTMNIPLKIASHRNVDALKFNFTWNNNGIVYKIRELTSIKTLEMIRIPDGLNNKEKSMHRPDYGPGELKIVYDKRPVKNFIGLSLKEKDKFAVLVALDLYIFITSMTRDLEKVNYCELYENDSFLNYIDPPSYYSQALSLSTDYGFMITKEWNKDAAFVNVFFDSEIDPLTYDEIIDKHPKKYTPGEMLREFCMELELRIPKNSIKNFFFHPFCNGFSIKIFNIPFSKIPLDKDAAIGLFDLLYSHQMNFANLLEDICAGKDRINWKQFNISNHNPIITII